jgi:hypothetical protein
MHVGHLLHLPRGGHLLVPLEHAVEAGVRRIAIMAEGVRLDDLDDGVVRNVEQGAQYDSPGEADADAEPEAERELLDGVLREQEVAIELGAAVRAHIILAVEERHIILAPRQLTTRHDPGKNNAGTATRDLQKGSELPPSFQRSVGSYSQLHVLLHSGPSTRRQDKPHQQRE